MIILVLPPAALLFVLMHWSECKRPFVIYLIAIGMFGMRVNKDPYSLVGDETRAIADICRRVSEAAKNYKQDNQTLPENSGVLLAKGYLTQEEAYDPWGSELQIDTYQGKLIVWSMGPDKSPDPADNFSFAFK
ncbi:MAG: hypothetical protein E2O57_00415 [Gammaproteobacteria bacterium]|nr:MAG: hypothetical protein E2O57_00415 [Gammaproteobacteria bacterium]